MTNDNVKFNPNKSLLEAIREARTAKLARETAKSTGQVTTRQAQAIVNDPLKTFFQVAPTPAKLIKEVKKEESVKFQSALEPKQKTEKPNIDNRQKLNYQDIAVKKDVPAPARQITQSAGGIGDISNVISNIFSSIFGGRR